MADRTPRFGFTTFNQPGDTLALHGHKAYGADREALDRLLTAAVETHRHDGTQITVEAAAPPTVWLDPDGGALPASTAVYYRLALVDRRGQEHMASTPAVTYTPPIVPTPGPPTLAPTNGTLTPGQWLYAITAWTNTSDRETTPSRHATITFTDFSGTIVTFPPPPSGADGWNVYRKGPTDYELVHLGFWTIDYPWISDQGATQSNELRGLPEDNTTSTTAAVTVGTAIEPDDGATWKIYRTFDPTNWENSLLVWTATLPYVDVGHGTRPGYPPARTSGVGGAPKINLATETTGTPPTAMAPTPVAASFSFPEYFEVGPSEWQWVNELDFAVLTSIRVALGRGATPTGQNVTVALEARAAGTDTWVRFESIDTGMDLVAEIEPGQQASDLIDFDLSDTTPQPVLLAGGGLRVVITQTGDEPRTDTDLVVNITGFGGVDADSMLSYVWSTS